MLVLQSGDSRRKKWNKKFCWCKAITFLKEKKHPIYHQPGGFRVVCAEFNGSITGKNDFYERWWIDAVWWKKILTLRKNRWNIVIFVLARNEKHFKLKPSIILNGGHSGQKYSNFTQIHRLMRLIFKGTKDLIKLLEYQIGLEIWWCLSNFSRTVCYSYSTSWKHVI